MKKVRKRILSAVLAGLTLSALVFSSAETGGSAEAAKVSSDSVEVESGSNYSYIYASDTGRAMTFRTHWVSSGSRQAVYCTQRSKSFNDDGDYTGAYWYSSALYSEMAYVVYHGCSYYNSKADSAFTTGSWVKDYYATQVAVWCIREDYGYDGVAYDDISAISGYEDVYECAAALYKAAKENAGSDGYGDTVSLSISEPSSAEMEPDSSGTYYKTGWYSIDTTGTLCTSSAELVNAPDGAEIVYEDSSDPGSRFYIRIPVSDVRALTSDSVSFKVKVSGTFTRPLVYNYYSEDSGDQNITYLQLLEDEDALSDTAEVFLSPAETGIEIYKTDSETGNGVAGAVYGVYSDEDCTDLAAELGPTDESGYASVSFIMHQETYYVKEISASEAYLVSTQVNQVTVVETGIGTVNTTEEEVKGAITVKKADAETGAYSALGSAALKGAVYGLYAAEDIVHPDGTTGVVYAAGELVSSLAIPESGSITFSDLYLGSYYVKEISAPVGYTTDETEYPVTLTYADQETEIIAQSLTVKEQVIRGDLSFKKVRESSQDPIEYAVFLITSDTTGESHVLVADEEGCVNTASSAHLHTENTNANDAAVSLDEDGNYVADESLLDPSAGIWFGLTEDGSITEANDSLGALPYDTYMITELSTSANEGLVLVTLEVTISQDGIVIDLGSVDDPDIPAITTSAADAETGIANSYADDDVTIIDTVSYIGLTPGETYTVTGILMDRDTGAPLPDASGSTVTAEQTFRAEKSCGTIEVTYSFDASGLEDVTAVVFETLCDADGEWVASHEDLEDEGQTICFPEIETTALDSGTGTHEALADEEVTIIDTVSCSNLIIGKEYTVFGILYDKDTGEPIRDAQGNEVTAQITFTAEESDGSVETVFTFDASLLDGKTAVAFETLTYEEKTVAVHADLADEGQSVSLKSPPEESETVETDDAGRSMLWILAASAGLLLLGAAARKKTKNIRNN